MRRPCVVHAKVFGGVTIHVGDTRGASLQWLKIIFRAQLYYIEGVGYVSLSEMRMELSRQIRKAALSRSSCVALTGTTFYKSAIGS
jgi:hypothetical protein